MTLIEGIGDEVTHFFIALFVILIGKLTEVYSVGKAAGFDILEFQLR